MVRGLMSDKEWAFFKLFVIETGPRHRRPPGDHRLVLDGVFWIARTGAPLRDLPEEFGKWGSVYRQFRRWCVAGVWDAMLEALNATGMAPSSVQMIDSTIVRAHQHASGAKRWAHQESIGRCRGGQTTKIHLRTNSIGLPIAVTLSSGEASDYITRGMNP